jgi:carbon-monoxide dehydrogenase large subunit
VPGQAYGVFVRAPVSHAAIRASICAARAMPGVLGAYAARTRGRRLGAIPPVAVFPGRDGKPMFRAAMPVLAVDRIRYVGEPVAIVVAETLAQAQDAAERCASITTSCRALRLERALGRRARDPRSAPGNVALDWTDGNAATRIDGLRQAAHVERVRLDDTRLAPVSMEPRAGIGSFDPASGRYTLIASTQGVAVVRKLLAEGVFKVPLTTCAC